LFAFCLPFVCLLFARRADGCCRIIVREIYGATDIEISEKAAEQMERFAPRVAVPHAKFSAILFSRFASYFYFFCVRYTSSGYGGLPICMAKTQYR
jgi:hypothetical protein